METTPLDSIDLTRRYQTVTLRAVVVPVTARVGEPGTADTHDAALLDISAVLQAGEIVGAARLVGTGRADARTWASTAKAYVGRVGPEAIQDCVQLHGGIGVTYEHDLHLHLYLRRALADAQLFGTPAYFTERLVRLVEAAVADGGRAQ